MANLFKALFQRDFASAILRFPVSILCFLGIAAWSHFSLHGEMLLLINKFHFLALVCSAFATVGVSLFFESQGTGKALSFVAQLGVAAAISAYIIIAQEHIFVPIAILISAFAFLMVAPFIKPGVENRQIANFTYHVMTAGVLGLVVGGIFTGGGMAIASTLQALFNLPIYTYFWGDVVILGMCIITPLYALATIPSEDEIEDERETPAHLRNIVKWLIIPVVTIYMLIFFAYAIKIGVEWTLPKGILAYLTLGFAGLGLITYCILPVLKEQSVLARLYDKWFFVLLIPALGMLCLSLYMRIEDYGFTAFRYASALIAFWLVVSMLHNSITRQRHTRFYALSLSVLFLLASFGPWGAISISANSQKAHLVRMMKRHDLVKDGKFVKSRKKIPFNDRKDISSALIILKTYKRLELVKPYFPDSSSIHKKPVKDVHAPGLMKELGMKYVEHYFAKDKRELYYTAPMDDYKEDMDITNFKHLGKAKLTVEKTRNVTKKLGKNDHVTFAINHQGTQLEIKLKSGHHHTYDLTKIAADAQHMTNTIGRWAPTGKNLVYEVQINKRPVTIRLNTLRGSITETDTRTWLLEFDYFIG